MSNEIPEHCPQPDRPCQWERERKDLREEMRDMRDLNATIASQISEIHSALAVGSERFKSSVAQLARIEALEIQIQKLTLDVAKLLQTVVLLRTILFSGIGVTLLTVLGALLGLVIFK